ncbi:unnamed protein product [Soboliphyme baturini]|uniref:Secreted protein n=1 Tax=Soboliphyme baturini TaxID=241478 RepID=A0A183IDT1_9BILA|nr:unnamed protein product [Soboliphyme baturini]
MSACASIASGVPPLCPPGRPPACPCLPHATMAEKTHMSATLFTRLSRCLCLACANTRTIRLPLSGSVDFWTKLVTSAKPLLPARPIDVSHRIAPSKVITYRLVSASVWIELTASDV